MTKKKIKLGLFSYSYHLAFGAHEVFQPKQKMDIFQFMDKTKAYGLDGIQIDAMHLLDESDSYLGKVSQYAKDNELYVEYGVTGVAETYLIAQLEVAKKLAAPILRTFIGFNPAEPSVYPDREVAEAIRVLNKVKVKAEDYNIKIAIENHCDLTTDELLRLIKAIDSSHVGVCVDLGNFMIHLENPVASVRKLAPYIINTHFKDYAATMENWGFKYFGVALGDGKIDLDAVLKILLNESQLDRIMLEIPVEKEASEEATLYKEDLFVGRSIKYARETLGIK